MNIPTVKILLKKGILSDEQLVNAEKLSQESNIGIEEAVKQLKYTSSEVIAKCLAEYYNVEFLDVENGSINCINTKLVQDGIAMKYGFIPVEKNKNTTIIAVCKPPDLITLDNVRFILGTDIKWVLITPESFNNSINQYINTKKDAPILPSVENILDDYMGANEESVNIQLTGEKFIQSETNEDDTPIIRIVMHIISDAVKVGASDIHLEPLPGNLRIRYRIDGVCHHVRTLPKQIQGATISRVKIMASIDITERRKPQDGRISLMINDHPLDLRVSIIPVTNGESIVMRLLESESIMVSLDELGFDHDDYMIFQSLIRRPNGIILVTGPTGSGKTTTLYASLNKLNTPEKKIITVENPIEYDLKGVNQCEVNEVTGLTFPIILRSILRQDPNIVIVGEIRDLETAEIAITAALTGHLILSTLHTNDAPSAITRLTDMGAKSYLLATSVISVMAQRLVRVICKKCKEPFSYTQKQLLEVGLNPDEVNDVVFYKGKGCDICKGSGYKGRVGIYELMVINKEIKELIYKKESQEKIKNTASDFGMKSLKDDGLRKVFKGITTIEEVIRVAGQ